MSNIMGIMDFTMDFTSQMLFPEFNYEPAQLNPELEQVVKKILSVGGIDKDFQFLKVLKPEKELRGWGECGWEGATRCSMNICNFLFGKTPKIYVTQGTGPNLDHEAPFFIRAQVSWIKDNAGIKVGLATLITACLVAVIFHSFLLTAIVSIGCGFIAKELCCENAIEFAIKNSSLEELYEAEQCFCRVSFYPTKFVPGKAADAILKILITDYHMTNEQAAHTYCDRTKLEKETWFKRESEKYKEAIVVLGERAEKLRQVL